MVVVSGGGPVGGKASGRHGDFEGRVEAQGVARYFEQQFLGVASAFVARAQGVAVFPSGSVRGVRPNRVPNVETPDGSRGVLGRCARGRRQRLPQISTTVTVAPDVNEASHNTLNPRVSPAGMLKTVSVFTVPFGQCTSVRSVRAMLVPFVTVPDTSVIVVNGPYPVIVAE